jgi:hypothetical protein
MLISLCARSARPSIGKMLINVDISMSTMYCLSHVEILLALTIFLGIRVELSRT